MSHDETLGEIQGTLGGIDAKLDQLLSAKDDHEARLRALERWRGILQGAWLVLGAAIAWVARHF